MGKKLTGGDFPVTPVVGVSQVVNSTFTGVILDKGNERKLKRGKKFVYLFKVVSGDMPVQIKEKGTENYKNFDVKPGETVSLFAPTVLHQAFQKAETGSTLKIVYLGQAKTKNGTDFHNFDVEVVE